MKITIFNSMTGKIQIVYCNVVSLCTQIESGILHYAIELEDEQIVLFQWSEFNIAIDDFYENHDYDIGEDFYGRNE